MFSKVNFPSVMHNKKFWLVLLCVALFTCISMYIFNSHIKKLIKPKYVANKEFVSDDNANVDNVDLYFFYTSWCPHCKTAFPIWDELKQSNMSIKGKTINYVEVDCDKDASTAEKFGVEGYPTIKLVNGNTVVEYDAKPDVDTLLQFLNASV